MVGSPHKTNSRSTRSRQVTKMQPKVKPGDEEDPVETNSESKPKRKTTLRRTQSAVVVTLPTVGGGERMSLAERRRRQQQNMEDQAKKSQTLKRSISWNPSSAIHLEKPAFQALPTMRRMGTGSKFYHALDHSGDKYIYETGYSFWSSKSAMGMLCFVALALKYQDCRFLCGATAVFLYHTFRILGRWKRFIANHPIVKDFSDFTLQWFHYALLQVERFCDQKDRTRKAAVGIFHHTYPITTEFVGDYIRDRRAEVAEIALAEAERMRNRLSKAT